MTQLAHDCVMLEIPVDTVRLYSSDDPYYALWLQGLADRVMHTKREQNSRAKKGKK